MLAPPVGACEVQKTIVYPVNAEVKAGAMSSLGVNSQVLNEGFAWVIGRNPRVPIQASGCRPVCGQIVADSAVTGLHIWPGAPGPSGIDQGFPGLTVPRAARSI